MNRKLKQVGISSDAIVEGKRTRVSKKIVDVLEGKEEVVDCSSCGKSKKCLTKNVWKKIDDSISKTLQSITLADLIK